MDFKPLSGFSSMSISAMDKMMQWQIQNSLSLSDAKAPNSMIIAPEQPIETLYLHIPFCHTLCRYCSFHKVKFNEVLARDYFKALRQEISSVINLGFRFNRVYVGGGTTTILEDELIATIELILSKTRIREVSCESDPIYFHEGQPQRLTGLVDRMSIGVQSFEDRILKATGRYEKFGSGQEQYEYIHKAVSLFPTVNMDMMYGFTGQTPDSIAIDLEKAMSLQPEQITTYPLTPGIGKNRKKCASISGMESELWGQFVTARSCLTTAYDMEFPWTYSQRKQRPVEHKYVLDGEDCFGVGSGAFGRFGNRFLISSFDIQDYIDSRKAAPARSGIQFEKQISDQALMQHHLMIMMGHGIVRHKEFELHTGQSLWRALPLEMSFLLATGAIKSHSDGYQVTEMGQFVALKMFSGFLSGMDYLREQARELVQLQAC
ncbi:coproporphyrinogen III oxidase family protein [Shewanella corallii]|uniref:Coproporphyrinogen III oxidase family protein n=1 Tax=Shewanella corallii TaxID=560080 RepID=A0ABT0N5S9_9GAMM|nr:coproporphyrinogen III oxidase family protein [Shewanella corallii]MCL2913740.1 coproporphyrinogen III oxidase family protein [Shewanella corallii]